MALASHPLTALKQAVRDYLAGDADLTGFLAGNAVFDEAPRGNPAPFAVFADATVRDASTNDARAYEILFGILLQARASEGALALDAASRIDALLTDASLTLDGHRLVSLQATETQMRQRNDREPWRVTLRLRAFVEPM